MTVEEYRKSVQDTFNEHGHKLPDEDRTSIQNYLKLSDEALGEKLFQIEAFIKHIKKWAPKLKEKAYRNKMKNDTKATLEAAGFQKYISLGPKILAAIRDLIILIERLFLDLDQKKGEDDFENWFLCILCVVLLVFLIILVVGAILALTLYAVHVIAGPLAIALDIKFFTALTVLLGAVGVAAIKAAESVCTNLSICKP